MARVMARYIQPAGPRAWLVVWSVLLAMLLSACTVQLAPTYDRAVAEGLAKANSDALTLFASVEDGAPVAGYPAYQERYAAIIGAFDALQQRASTRHIPPLAARLSRFNIVQSFCHSDSDPTGCVNASPASLTEVLRLLRQMRRIHRTRGLTSEDVALFRDGYNPAIGQALTVENALQR